jgi:hypothetical protein
MPIPINGQLPRTKAGTAGAVIITGPELHTRRLIRAGLECRGYSIEEADGYTPELQQLCSNNTIRLCS